MKIGIDIDNVITNTTECVVNYINERLPNVNLKMENITSYWIEDALPPEYGWIVEMAFSDKTMWKNVKIIDNAAEAIEALYRDGHEIYFATATTAENFRKKVGFLTREFSFFPDDYVRQHSISIKQKQLLDLDILVDDFMKNLTGERSYWSICFDYPWNQLSGDGSFMRANNWEEIYLKIKMIEEELNGAV